jgi:hypothetical protein
MAALCSRCSLAIGCFLPRYGRCLMLSWTLPGVHAIHIAAARRRILDSPFATDAAASRARSTIGYPAAVEINDILRLGLGRHGC